VRYDTVESWSFDVLLNVTLSKRKFGIVCHEKVVRIPLEGDEILRVHGELEFRVDLVPGATPVVKSPYRLAPLEMQDLSSENNIEVTRTKVGRSEPFKTVRADGLWSIQYGVEGLYWPKVRRFKQENVRAERLHGYVRNEISSVDFYSDLRWMIYLVVLADAFVESVRTRLDLELLSLHSSRGLDKCVVALFDGQRLEESSLTGPE
ncbi:hypothetical protein Tco_0570960, partial [Tanacetum coccineum]